jgi:hypothetical protein
MLVHISTYFNEIGYYFNFFHGFFCSAPCHILKKRKKKKPRRWWCTDLYRKRAGGELLQILKSQELSGQYKNFTRMSPTYFENLLMKIGPIIFKKTTHLREPISIQDRLVYLVIITANQNLLFKLVF